MEQIIEQSGGIPDIVLVKKILCGEKKLFELIIRRYNQRLFRIGLSILNHEEEAEDAMQTTYIKAYEHLEKFENRSSFGTWLTRIMINECLAQKMKKQRLNSEMQKLAENNMIMTTPVQVLMNKELSHALENAISQLPEKYRLVFILREIEGMSVHETGEALEIEEANVKVRLNRAKTMLQGNLNEYMKDHVYAFHLSRCDRMVKNVLTTLRIN
jgi:RNA polymerase sigma-70 factor (ECF subfamily)